MPVPPFASLTVSIAGGGAVTGAVTALNGQSCQLNAASTAFWQTAKWEIFAFPSGFSVPAGWTDDGAGTYYFLGIGPPPAFNLPALGSWGKFLFRLTVNNGLSNGVADPTLKDESTAVQILSPGGLTDIAAGESNQFSATRKWTKGIQDSFRQIEASLTGGTSPITTSTLTLTSTPLSFALGVASPVIQQAAKTSDAAPQDLTAKPQAAFASATGANRKPGDFIIGLSDPTNGGTTLAITRVKYGSNTHTAFGRYDSATTHGAYWAGTPSPTQQNFAFLGDGAAISYLNVPTNGAIHLAFNGVASTGLTVDQSASLITSFLNAHEFAGQYSSAASSQAFTATPTFNFNLSNNHAMAAATANITSVTLSNPRSGAIYTIMCTQDGTGNRTIAWPGTTRFEGTDGTFAVTANNVTVWTFLYDGAVYRCIARKVHAT